MSAFDAHPHAAAIVDDMRHWITQAVVGLNLCPFAKSVFVRAQVHYAVSRARSWGELDEELRRELQDLVDADPQQRDTTLLVVPDMFGEFLEFNDYLLQADRQLGQLDLVGVVQIASFHPRYQFAGTSDDDVANFTNRAPYPTLHLLRESSVERAVAAVPDADTIVERNLATLARLGSDGWQRLGIRRSVPVPDGAAGPAPPPRGKIRR